MKKKSSTIKNFIILHATLLLYTISSVFSKIASNQEFLSLNYILSYGMVLFILFVYALVWQQILKETDLTVAYANKAIVIVWGILWGAVLFDEKIRLNMVAGAVIIMIGIWMVAKDNES